MSSSPPLSVNQVTTPHLSFPEALDVYREAGVDAIGIIDSQALRDDPHALERLRSSGLRAGFCILSTTSVLPLPLGGPYAGVQDPEARVDEMCESVRRLAPFDPVFCMVSPGPSGDLGEDEAAEIVARGVKRVAQAAGDVGVTVALEPFHPTLREFFSSGNSIPEAVALLEAVDEPNVGILFDIWHLWDSPGLLDQIRENAHHVLGVHLDDWREPTRSWCDRVLPGDGVADVEGILRAFDEAGFAGWYELEIMSDDGTYGDDFPDSLAKRDPLELIREGREKFLRAWRATRCA
jgi:sugar phosphate isomerase/epimerase